MGGLVASYRPIALTSHVGKLAERLINSRLTCLSESRGLVLPEQVGFWAGRTVEDSLGRLIQEVARVQYVVTGRAGGPSGWMATNEAKTARRSSGHHGAEAGLASFAHRPVLPG